MNDKERINRRKFLKLSAAGFAIVGGAALNIDPAILFGEAVPNNTKELFMKCGTCSRTYTALLNREFGHPDLAAELASDSLAGGLKSTQNQCGMLWGASLAAGAESFRKYHDHYQALISSIAATRHIMDSFRKRTKAVNCRDITCDFSNSFETTEFMLKSLPGGFKNVLCMNLAEKWAPEAIRSANEGLSKTITGILHLPISCASEVIRRMGGSNKEIVSVAGFAGGMGLSGNACGALGSTIWYSSLEQRRNNHGQSDNSSNRTKEIIETFNGYTGSSMLCSEITGESFKTIDEHTVFVKNGGCENLISILART